MTNELEECAIFTMNVVKRYTVFTNDKQFEIEAIDIEDAWRKAEFSNIVTHNNLTVENVMIHFSEMRSRIDRSEAVENVVHIEGFLRHERTICPECRTHKQGKSSEVHDCKTVFIRDGETVGQCQCYSKEHGYRTR